MDDHMMAGKHPESLPHLVKRHSSRLIKILGDSDLQLQKNKVVNLNLIAPLIDGVRIGPGEAFSFCRLVGKPTRKRGFLPGMELSMGKARSGVGGGICQMANLLHWLVLHSPLTVTERSAHSFDPFPDQNRSMPFGTGCAVFYNYVDLCFRNDTDDTFQFKIWITDDDLWGELRSDRKIAHTYKIYEQNHRFLRRDGEFYRSNEIWRRVMERSTGRHIRDEKLKENFVRVMYRPEVWEEE
jgi:vancomycin resistance protein VanW